MLWPSNGRGRPCRALHQGRIAADAISRRAVTARRSAGAVRRVGLGAVWATCAAQDLLGADGADLPARLQAASDETAQLQVLQSLLLALLVALAVPKWISAAPR